MFRKDVREDTPRRRYVEKEHGFKLPLPMTVEGMDVQGRSFQETTTLAYMSAKRASFGLRAPVAPGTQLRLTISLPPKLAEDMNLKLVIQGQALLVEPGDPDNGSQQVSLKLASRYIIAPEGGSGPQESCS